MDWLTNAWNSARDEIRFRLAERHARQAMVADAAVEFPTAEIDLQLEVARAGLAAELDRRFDEPMRANRERMAAAQLLRDRLWEELSLLDRDHRSALEEAHLRKAAARSELDDAKVAIDHAHRDLREARSRISSWHARSRSRLPFYGKRGRPIPRYSPFVFSHSDLDAAKKDAARAASRVGAATRDRESAWLRLRRIAEEIDAIKESRARRRALLDVGRNKSAVDAEFRLVASDIVHVEGADGRLAKLRQECIRDGAAAREIAALMERARLQIDRRAAAVAAFDSPPARNGRRAAFGA